MFCLIFKSMGYMLAIVDHKTPFLVFRSGERMFKNAVAILEDIPRLYTHSLSVNGNNLFLSG